MAKKRKAKHGSAKIISTIIMIILVVGAVLWFFGGKPYVELGAEGVSLVQTEEPLAKTIADILKGEEQPQSQLVSESESAPKVASAPKAASAADQGYEENDPLFLGNPTDALTDIAFDSNYLMVKTQYTLSYNAQTFCPNWVAWHLANQDMGKADRSDDFRADPELPEAWYAIKKADYQYNKYGFDRGHVCPSADRTATKTDNSMTFLMTNMVPQSPDNNRIIWMHFENFERELVNAGNELYLIAGPYGSGGTSSKGTFEEIPVTLKSGQTVHMNVPAYTWKVLLAIPEGEDDLSRLDSATAIAINVPNKMGMQKTGDWEQFLCSIDEIEGLTGYDFFELLSDEIEDKLEAFVYTR